MANVLVCKDNILFDISQCSTKKNNKKTACLKYPNQGSKITGTSLIMLVTLIGSFQVH